jgi:hypothetical protein
MKENFCFTRNMVSAQRLSPQPRQFLKFLYDFQSIPIIPPFNMSIGSIRESCYNLYFKSEFAGNLCRSRSNLTSERFSSMEVCWGIALEGRFPGVYWHWYLPPCNFWLESPRQARYVRGAYFWLTFSVFVPQLFTFWVIPLRSSDYQKGGRDQIENPSWSTQKVGQMHESDSPGAIRDTSVSDRVGESSAAICIRM